MRDQTLVPDMAAIDALIDWAETEDSKGAASGWDQYNFATPRPEAACGTAYCVAGKWAIDHGWTSQPGRYGLTVWTSPGGRRTGSPADAADAAADALGLHRLHDTYGRHLFDADNTVADLRQIANQLRTETEAADA